MRNLRKVPRRRFEAHAGVLHRGTYEMTRAMELSEGGMLLSCDSAIRKGSKIVLNFFVPGKKFISVTGEVLYQMYKENFEGEKIPCLGLRFTDLEFTQKRSIREFIASRTSEDILDN